MQISLFDEQERNEMAFKFLDDVGIDYEKAEVEEYAKEQRTQADMIKFATQIVIRKVMQENEWGDCSWNAQFAEEN